jgi:hypothetical protein
MDRREVDINPELAFLVESDEFFVSAAVVADLFQTAVAVPDYAGARDALLSGWSVIVRSDRPYGPVKDRFGFCTPQPPAPHRPAPTPGWAVVRGVTDNTRRPGLLLFGPNAPAGKELVKLPHGVWFPVPAGGYFVDACAFNTHTTAAWAVA